MKHPSDFAICISNYLIAVLFLSFVHPPNILRSKKAITRRRDITTMSVN